MNRSPHDEVGEALAEALATKHERRRRGRAEVSAALIPLLRGTVTVAPAPDGPSPETALDPSFLTGGTDRAARGLLIGLLLSVPLWGIVAAAGYWMLHAVIGP